MVKLTIGEQAVLAQALTDYAEGISCSELDPAPRKRIDQMLESLDAKLVEAGFLPKSYGGSATDHERGDTLHGGRD